MPYVGQLMAAGLAKEASLGVLQTPPTEFLPIYPPESFMPAITLLESTAIRALPDRIYKAMQGPGEVKGMKAKWEAEPENIGNLLMAAFGTDNVTGAANTGYTHAFTRLVAAQLPTYSWWLDKGAKQLQFLGCMLNKLDITAKTKEFVLVESEWVGLSYDNTGAPQTPVYSAVKPWKFDMATVKIDGGAINNYDNVKVTFDNFVKADHALSGSIYPAKIYSEGFEVTVTMDLFVEDATEYAKFLAGGSTAIQLVLTHSDNITGADPGNPYKLTIDIPDAKYSVASYPLPSGIIKISFTARGIYYVASTKTVSAELINSVSAAY